MTTDKRSYRGHLAVVIGFCLVCLLFFVTLMRAGGADLVPTQRYEVQAVVPSAVALSPGAEVRMAGVRVGRVQDIAGRGGDSVVRFGVDDEHAPVYRDARVQIRLKSLVGENYLDVDPGSPRAGAVDDDGLLTIAQADEAVQLDEIISTLDARTRRDLQGTLDGLATTLDGRGGKDLNRTFEGVSDGIERTRGTFAELTSQRRQVASLVDDLGRVMRAVGDRGGAIETLARGLRTSSEAVARRDAGLRATIEQLPATLAQARTTAGTLSHVSPRATPLLRDIGSALHGLSPVLSELRPTAAKARTTVDRLRDFAPQGRSILARLRPVADSATAAMPALDRSLAQLNPALSYVSRYARDVAVAFGNLRSVTDSYDATGNVARIHGIVGDSSVAGILNGEQQKALDALLEVGALSKLRARGNNQYPEPGGTAKPKPFTGKYPRVEATPLADPRSDR